MRANLRNRHNAFGSRMTRRVKYTMENYWTGYIQLHNDEKCPATLVGLSRQLGRDANGKIIPADPRMLDFSKGQILAYALTDGGRDEAEWLANIMVEQFRSDYNPEKGWADYHVKDIPNKSRVPTGKRVA